MRRTAISATLALVGLATLAAPARATFHLNMVNEVMLASASGDASTQFVEFLDSGGTEEQFTPVFAPYKLVVYDAAGNELGQQTLSPAGLRAAAAGAREYLVSTAAVDAAFAVTGDERLTVQLPLSAGQVCFAGNEPAPHAVSCMSWGAITKPVATNSFGTGSVHGPIPPNGSSDQRQPDGSVTVAPPTPKAPNRSATPPPKKGGKPTESHVSLSGVAKRNAKLSFTVSAGSNAPALEKIVVGLPPGLSYDVKQLARGLTVKGPSGTRLTYSAKLLHGTLTITLRTAATTVAVTVGSPTINVSKGLASDVKNHKVKQLTVVVKVADANGTVTRFGSKLSAR
jgi:hypothetical protein